jgi:hypothetical protein
VPIPSNRNSAGQGSIVFYVIGLVCAAVGIFLSTITRINLLSGQTSMPYLRAGIPLIIIGIVAVGMAKQTAKRNLGK